MNCVKIQLTKGYSAIIDAEDEDFVNRYSWHANDYRKSSVRACARVNYKLVDMARYILKVRDSEKHVDHIDGNPLNNQRSNLRIVTRSQNMMNKRKMRTKNGKRPSSPFKGVFFERGLEKWRAQIVINGKNKHLGVFLDEKDAARAYDLAAQEHFGEYAKVNGIGG